MQIKNSILAPALLALLFAAPVWADADEFELTMEIMDSTDDFEAHEMRLDDIVEDDEAREFNESAGDDFDDQIADIDDDTDEPNHDFDNDYVMDDFDDDDHDVADDMDDDDIREAHEEENDMIEDDVLTDDMEATADALVD